MDATLDWMRRLSSTLIRPAHPAVPLPEKRGWLTLNGKRFFFVLRSGRLSFFPNENSTAGGKRFNLAECHVKKVVSPYGLLIEITREKKSGRYVIAADSPAELDLWFASVGVSAKSTRDEAEVLGSAANADAHTGQVFGVPLRQVLAAARHSSHGMLPNVVRDCLAHLDTPRAFATPCLFTQEVEVAKLAPWVAAYNNGVRPFSPNAPATLIACLLKYYFKCLPAPLISEELHKELQVGRTNPMALRRIVGQMGQDSRFLLRSLCDLLNNLAFESKQEGNSAVELGTVFAPLLIWRQKKNSDVDEEMFVLRSIMAMGTMILHYTDVFEELAEEALKEKEESSVDAFDELVAELKAATPRKDKDNVIKKPLPSLADWAKELRSAPSRPQLPVTFREAAAEQQQKERDEGLGALEELEAELEAEKVVRKSGVMSPTVLSPSTSLDWAEVRRQPLSLDSNKSPGSTINGHHHAAEAPPSRFVVALDGDHHAHAQPDEKQLQEVERARALRASRRSNLTPSQLASIRGRLESQIGGGSRGHTPPTPVANPKEKEKEHTTTAPQRSTSPAEHAQVSTGVQVKQLVLGLERNQYDVPPPPPTAGGAATREVKESAPNPSSTAPPGVMPLALPCVDRPLLAIVASSVPPQPALTLPQQIQTQSQAQRDAMAQARSEVSAVVAKLKFDVLAWAEASALQLNQLHAQQQAELRRLVAEATRPLDAALDALILSASPIASPAEPAAVPTSAPPAMALSDSGGEQTKTRSDSKKEKKEKKEKKKSSSKVHTRPQSPPSGSVGSDSTSPLPSSVSATAVSEAIQPAEIARPASVPVAPLVVSTSTTEVITLTLPPPKFAAPSPPQPAPISAATAPAVTSPPVAITTSAVPVRTDGPLLSKPLPPRPQAKSGSLIDRSTSNSSGAVAPGSPRTAAASINPPPPVPRPVYTSPPRTAPTTSDASSSSPPPAATTANVMATTTTTSSSTLPQLPKSPPLSPPGIIVRERANTKEQLPSVSAPAVSAPAPSQPVAASQALEQSAKSNIFVSSTVAAAAPSAPAPAPLTAPLTASSSAPAASAPAPTVPALPVATCTSLTSVAPAGAPLPSPNLARLDAILARVAPQQVTPATHSMSLSTPPPSYITLGSLIDPGPVLVLKGADDPAFCVEVTAVRADNSTELPLLLCGVTLLGVLPDLPLPFRKLRLASAAQFADLPTHIRLRFSLLRHLGSSYATTGALPLLSDPIQLVRTPNAPPSPKAKVTFALSTANSNPVPASAANNAAAQHGDRPRIQQTLASLVRAVRQMGLEPQSRSTLLGESEALCASVLLGAKDLVVENLTATDENRQNLMAAAKTLGMTVAKLVRLYQDEVNEAAAEKQAFELRRILKEAVLAMVNVLPIFTGSQEDSGSLRNLDLSTASLGSEANAPFSPSVGSPSSRFDPTRRLSLPASPKRAPFSPTAASSPTVSIPRADKDYPYQELCRDGDRKKSPPGCDIAALETYLSDAEFERVLKMTRPQFYVLPPWRQRQLKVAVKLW